MLDNFREWLSDNLRYILLILAIFVALALVFFGIRAISGARSGGRSARTEEETTATESETTATESENVELDNESIEVSEPTVTPTAVPEALIIGGELKEDIYPDVATVITAYYESRQNHYVDGVRAVVDVLPEEEAQVIEASSTIYSDLKIYTKEGPEGDDSSFVAYISYKYQNADQSTMFPGLERMLVRKDENGEYKIVFSELDEPTSDYIDTLADSDDIKELIARIQNEYDTAQAIEDANRAARADSSQEEGGVSDGEVVDHSALVISDVNLREGAGTEYPVITVLKAGQTVTIVGEEYNGCYYVVSGSGDGYVNADYLEIQGVGEASEAAIAPDSAEETSDNTESAAAPENTETAENADNTGTAAAENADNAGTAASEDAANAGETAGTDGSTEAAEPAPEAAQNYPDTWSDTVNAAGVNLRAAEGMDAAIIGVLTRGETVTVTGTAHNGWYHVVASTLGEGYVGSRYVGSSSPESDQGVWSDLINGGVNLRAAESMDAAIIGVLQPGESVSISGGAHNGWYHVVASRLGEGYVGTRFVGAVKEQTASQTPAVTTTADTAGQAVPEATASSTAPVYEGERAATVRTGCNLRQGPGADYAVVGVLAYGAQVSILGTSDNGNWYHIRTAIGEGYVNTGFLS